MSGAQLPIASLPAWSLLNDVCFLDAKISSVPKKGYGLVAERCLSTREKTFDIPGVLSVPGGLVLNVEAVEQYAKQDREFRQLLDKVGHQSARGDILLFLLVHFVLGSKAGGPPAGLSSPWTEYIKFLPHQVPVPTLWTEAERSLLQGTSLESAINAKLLALEQEYDRLEELSSELPFWRETFWDSRSVNLGLWFLLDAWYRSRCLELPKSGESLVPCLDMVNHESRANAYYEEAPNDEVVLLLQSNLKVSAGDEITIHYGNQKSAPEMLFCYGFIDPCLSINKAVFRLEPFPDDPLAKAKLHVFGLPPTVTFWIDEEDLATKWDSPFAYLMCVNEEDGLNFRLLQETDGEQQLRMFWQEDDVTERAGEFEKLTQEHELSAVIRLRVITVLHELCETQRDRMAAATELAEEIEVIRDERAQQAELLRELESQHLVYAVHVLEKERSQLLADENVVAYLGSMEVSQSELVEGEAANEEEDFS